MKMNMEIICLIIVSFIILLSIGIGAIKENNRYDKIYNRIQILESEKQQMMKVLVDNGLAKYKIIDCGIASITYLK